MKKNLIFTALTTFALVFSGCSSSNNDSSSPKQTQTINSTDGKAVSANVLDWEIPNRIRAGEKGTIS